MKRFIAAITTACILGFAGQAFSAPLKIEDVPKDAKWLVHMDVDWMVKSKLGTMMLDPEKMDAKAKVGLAFIKGLTGVDMLKDISGVTMYGKDFKGESGVVVVHGNIPQEQIVNLIKINKKNEMLKDGSRTIYTWVDDRHGKPGALCFLDGGLTVAAKDAASIKAAIAVLEDSSKSLKDGGELKAPDTKGAFVIMSASKCGEELAQKAQAAMLQKSIQEATMFIAEDGDSFTMKMDVSFENNETAAQAEQVVKGMFAFAGLSQQKNPTLANLVKCMTVKNDDGILKIELATTVKQMYEFIKAQKEMKGKCGPGGRCGKGKWDHHPKGNSKD